MDRRRRLVTWGLPYLATLVVRVQAIDLEGGTVTTLWTLSAWRLVLIALAHRFGGVHGGALAAWLSRPRPKQGSGGHKLFETTYLDGCASMTPWFDPREPPKYPGLSRNVYIATLNYGVDVSALFNKYARGIEDGDLDLTPNKILRLALLKNMVSTRHLLTRVLGAPLTTLGLMNVGTLSESVTQGDTRLRLESG